MRWLEVRAAAGSGKVVTHVAAEIEGRTNRPACRPGAQLSKRRLTPNNDDQRKQ
jgi:hypothetical protein